MLKNNPQLQECDWGLIFSYRANKSFVVVKSNLKLTEDYSNLIKPHYLE
jgi:hypothetical protein